MDLHLNTADLVPERLGVRAFERDREMKPENKSDRENVTIILTEFCTRSVPVDTESVSVAKTTRTTSSRVRTIADKRTVF